MPLEGIVSVYVRAVPRVRSLSTSLTIFEPFIRSTRTRAPCLSRNVTFSGWLPNSGQAVRNVRTGLRTFTLRDEQSRNGSRAVVVVLGVLAVLVVLVVLVVFVVPGVVVVPP